MGFERQIPWEKNEKSEKESGEKVDFWHLSDARNQHQNAAQEQTAEEPAQMGSNVGSRT